MKKGWISLIILLLYIHNANAQNISTSITQKTWDAYWISSKEVESNTYSIQFFRKTISLSAKPGQFIIHVSADNRYKLYVNGQLASLGPARGELYHWYFETVDIAPFLRAVRILYLLLFGIMGIKPLRHKSVFGLLLYCREMVNRKPS